MCYTLPPYSYIQVSVHDVSLRRRSRVLTDAISVNIRNCVSIEKNESLHTKFVIL
jgi:hypothetical protein